MFLHISVHRLLGNGKKWLVLTHVIRSTLFLTLSGKNYIYTLCFYIFYRKFPETKTVIQLLLMCMRFSLHLKFKLINHRSSKLYRKRLGYKVILYLRCIHLFLNFWKKPIIGFNNWIMNRKVIYWAN